MSEKKLTVRDIVTVAIMIALFLAISIVIGMGTVTMPILYLYGTAGIEMFIGEDNEIYINELAPRPHNSGHYSIEACNFSQFDIHNRAICNWPLPKIELLKPVVMVNVLGQHVEKTQELISKKPTWQFHDYGKGEIRVDRKMEHVTILTDDINKTLDEIVSTHVWD